MNRTIGKLSPLFVSRVKEPGMYGDGGGLWLQVSRDKTGADDAPPRKSWLFRYTVGYRPSAKDPTKKLPHIREMGLGPLHTVSLAEARRVAAECRQQVSNGVDPIEARRAAKAGLGDAAGKVVTFKQCTKEYIAAHKPGWKNTKHAQQWENTLATYAEPIIGADPVGLIDTPAVMKVLQQEVLRKGKAPAPLWVAKTETAKRLRGRIEAILDWARVMGYRDGENPARWRGHLDNLLPKPSKVAKVKHHPALPYALVPEFMRALRKQEGIAARALEFLILTTARTNEVIGLKKPEITLAHRMWVVPPDKMKGEREHRVPLSARAVEIAEAMNAATAEAEYVFPGRKRGSGLSNMAMETVLRRMQKDRAGGWNDDKGRKITVHGFRSTFRDWVAEQTSYPEELAEMALAHVNGDKTEAAYQRADLLEKRRRLMADWGAYCETERPAAQVVTIRAKAS